MYVAEGGDSLSTIAMAFSVDLSDVRFAWFWGFRGLSALLLMLLTVLCLAGLSFSAGKNSDAAPFPPSPWPYGALLQTQAICAGPHAALCTPSHLPWLPVQLQKVNPNLQGTDTGVIIQPGTRIAIPPFSDSCGDGARRCCCCCAWLFFMHGCLLTALGWS